MPFRLALRIALRHLLRRKRQTILATLGVMVGGAVFALMISISIGQRRYLRAKLVETLPHIVVKADLMQPIVAQNLLTGVDAAVELSAHTPPSTRMEIKPYAQALDRAVKCSQLITAVAPYVTVNGVMRNGTRNRAVTARGIEPAQEKRIGQLAQNIQVGRLDALSADPNGAIIGRGLSWKLAVNVGEDLSLVGPTGKLQTVRVVAIFASGVAEFDDRRVYVNIRLAQAMRQMGGNEVTGLSVQVSDLDRVSEVKEALQNATGYQAETWEEASKQILDFQGRQQSISRILVIFVFITAAFGISNMMIAIVLQKKQDIAVMKSFGVPRGGIVTIFLLEGMVIGLLGGVMAGLAGYGMAALFGTLNLFPQNNDSAFLRFDKFPIALDAGIYIFTCALSFLLSIIASILPARRAATFIPVQIIRGEV